MKGGRDQKSNTGKILARGPSAAAREGARGTKMKGKSQAKDRRQPHKTVKPN